MTGKKGRSGRPAFKPTDAERKLVGQMCAVGIPHDQIAMVVRDGIDADTLKKHFKEELRTAKIKANAKIGGTLFNQAINGNTSAAIFWAKTQMGWKEKSEIEHSGDINWSIQNIYEK
jgi:hypothetical protein